MRTNPQTRQRYAVNPPFGVGVVPKPGFTPPPNKVAGIARIFQGVFGIGSPTSRSSDPNEVENAKPGPLYHMHEGDIFEPGTGNWVLDPAFDGPLMCVWGHGDSYPKVWSVTDQPVVIALPTYLTNGIGGTIVGQIASGQPLTEETFNG
jgi:hypothetical protein